MHNDEKAISADGNRLKLDLSTPQRKLYFALVLLVAGAILFGAGYVIGQVIYGVL